MPYWPWSNCATDSVRHQRKFISLVVHRDSLLPARTCFIQLEHLAVRVLATTWQSSSSTIENCLNQQCVIKLLSSLGKLWRIGLTGNVFRHQFQERWVTLTILSRPTQKKNLQVLLWITLFPAGFNWSRNTGGAGRTHFMFQLELS